MIASSAGEGARRHSEFATSSASSLCCQTLMRRKSRGNAAYLSIRQTAPRVASRRTTLMKLDERRIHRPAGAASQPPIGGKLHDQIGESLRKLWRKVRPCQPPPSRPALLPQSLQGELPCENGEGPCVHATVVWLRTSPGFVGVARIEGSEIRGSAGSFVSPGCRSAPPGLHASLTRIWATRNPSIHATRWKNPSMPRGEANPKS
jgi:hypothetical protein